MARVVLFHTVRGLRDAERDLAARLTAAGHPTITPDLYDGEGSDDIEEGFAINERIGEATLLARARAALAGEPADSVLAGISFGVAMVGRLWAERPRAAGALFLSGIFSWPDPLPRVPAALHLARPDPYEPEDEVAAWIAAGPSGLAVHRYDGAGHAFLDPTLPDWDAQAAAACEARVLAFLDALA